MFVARGILVLCLLVFGLGPAVAQSAKVAHIDMLGVYRKYWKTRVLLDDIAIRNRSLRESEDIELLLEMESNLKSQIEAIAASDQSDDEKRAALLALAPQNEEFEATKAEVIDIQSERGKAINTDLADGMLGLLAHINSVIETYAVKNGYDLVVDSTGKSSSQTEVALYIGNATDITEDILAIINADKPDDVDASGEGVPSLDEAQPLPAPEIETQD